MGHWWKFLPQKCEYLSSGLIIHIKDRYGVICLQVQCWRGRDKWVAGVCWPASLAESVGPRFDERPCLKQLCEDWLRRITNVVHWYECAHPCICRYTCVHTHTQACSILHINISSHIKICMCIQMNIHVHTTLSHVRTTGLFNWSSPHFGVFKSFFYNKYHPWHKHRKSAVVCF